MSRTARLFRLMGALRARIDGDAGVGYVLRAGFFLPPLMFGEDEIEALVLGARWVQGQGDAELARAAEAVLPRSPPPRRATRATAWPTPACSRRVPSSPRRTRRAWP